jgi:hypothetical protein
MSTEQVFDFGEEFDELTPEQRTEKLGKLGGLIDDLAAAQALVKEREEELKAAQHRVKELEESTIPELMEELNMKSFETSSGMKVKVEEKIRVGRVKDPEALQWLEDRGHSGVIKTNVGVALPREEREKAKKLAAQLAEMGMDAKVESFVEWGTAASLLKELRENGEEVDFGLFKASDFRRVKVVR